MAERYMTQDEDREERIGDVGEDDEVLGVDEDEDEFEDDDDDDDLADDDEEEEA